jgi:hypothetical protein
LNLQVAAITPIGVKVHFAKGPLELFKRSQSGPQFTVTTLERTTPKQLGPRLPPAAEQVREVGKIEQGLTTELLVVDLGSGASPARGYDGDRRW